MTKGKFIIIGAAVVYVGISLSVTYLYGKKRYVKGQIDGVRKYESIMAEDIQDPLIGK